MVESAWSHNFLQRHHLVGYAYNRSKNKEFYPEWKNQLTRNFIIKADLEKIGEDIAFEGIDICLLKGFSLMGDLYEDWGIRFASDVDMLVSQNDFWRLSDVLASNGFRKSMDEKKWMANQHKSMFKKQVGDSEICIEVHTKLFWHTKLKWQESIRSANIKGFKNLSLEHQLLHLCGHLAFQHNFLKLFWLVDIYKFVEKNRAIIDWRSFWKMSIKHNLYRSCYITMFLCQKLGLNLQTVFFRAPKKSTLSTYFLKKLLTLRFLNDPRKHPFKYFAVKFLVKDSWVDSMKYIFYWIKNKV